MEKSKSFFKGNMLFESGRKMSKCKIIWADSRIRNIKGLTESLSVGISCSRKKLEEDIILSAFKKWGTDFGKHLCGRFSAVIEDTATNNLYLVRDHFGLAPLYYGVSDGVLYSSPSLRSLTEKVAFPKEVNEKALASYFIYGYPIGPDTFYKGIQKVMPGHCLIWNTVEKRFLSDVRWFIPEFNRDDSFSEADWLSALKNAVSTIMKEERDDIEKHSAVCLLSSGVDSSYLLSASGVPRAVSVGYSDAAFSEAEEAEKTAAFFDRNFRKIVCSEDDYADEYREYVRFADQPTVNPTVPIIASLCRKITDTADLLYSGEGADEFFAGYYPFTLEEFLSFTEKPYFGFGQSVPFEETEKLMKADCRWTKSSIPEEIYRDTEKSGSFSTAMWTDIHLYFEGDTCTYISYIINRFGLDVRLPFADPRLFELTSKIPERYLIHNVSETDDGSVFGKYIFRKLAAGKLPDETAFRPKRAFPAPVRQWIRTPKLRELFNEKIHSVNAGIFFNTEHLTERWEAFLSGDDSFWREIYAACTFLCWYETAFGAKKPRLYFRRGQ